MKSAERTPIETVISARQHVSLRFYLRELWDRRSLVGVLAGRELKSKYEMNVVGFAWWLLEPLSLTLVYVVVVSLIFRAGTRDIPYPLFVVIALLPYKWLASSLIGSMNVVRTNANLVTDVYFPRALLPITETVVGLAHFCVGLAVIPIFMIAYKVPTSWHLVFLPLVMATEFVLVLGIGYLLAVWGLIFRNLPGLTAQLLRLWFYLSPGLWDMSRVRVPWHRTLVELNPLTGIFLGYRNALIARHSAPWWTLAYSAGFGVVALLVGFWYFRRKEANFGKAI